MNWKEFKDYVENKGVTNDMDILCIKFGENCESSDLDVCIWSGHVFSVDVY